MIGFIFNAFVLFSISWAGWLVFKGASERSRDGLKDYRGALSGIIATLSNPSEVKELLAASQATVGGWWEKGIAFYNDLDDEKRAEYSLRMTEMYYGTIIQLNLFLTYALIEARIRAEPLVESGKVSISNALNRETWDAVSKSVVAGIQQGPIGQAVQVYAKSGVWTILEEQIAEGRKLFESTADRAVNVIVRTAGPERVKAFEAFTEDLFKTLLGEMSIYAYDPSAMHQLVVKDGNVYIEDVAVDTSRREPSQSRQLAAKSPLSIPLPDTETEEESDSISAIDIRVEEVDEEDTSESSEIEYDKVEKILGLSRIEEVVEEEVEDDSCPTNGGNDDVVVAQAPLHSTEDESLSEKQVPGKNDDLVSSGQSGSRRSSKSENYTLVEGVDLPSTDTGIVVSKPPVDVDVVFQGRFVEEEIKQKGREVSVAVAEVTEEVDLGYVDRALAVVEEKSRAREILEERRLEAVDIHIRSSESDLDNASDLKTVPATKSPVRKRKRLISAVFGKVLGKKSKTS
uniref:Uncharacterized protein n=1 Tax=Psilocybe cubensis TaxID=181762 RepID=A0A8H7XST9_PSICU